MDHGRSCIYFLCFSCSFRLLRASLLLRPVILPVILSVILPVILPVVLPIILSVVLSANLPVVLPVILPVIHLVTKNIQRDDIIYYSMNHVNRGPVMRILPGEILTGNISSRKTKTVLLYLQYKKLLLDNSSYYTNLLIVQIVLMSKSPLQIVFTNLLNIQFSLMFIECRGIIIYSVKQ